MLGRPTFCLALVLLTSTGAAASPPSGPSGDEPNAFWVASALGGTNDTRKMDSYRADTMPVVAVEAGYLRRQGMLLVGVTGRAASSFFAASHLALGGVAGLAVDLGTGHAELLVDAGVHAMRRIGAGVLSGADGSANVPYGGANVRWVVDVGAPGDWSVDLGLALRRDLATRHVRTKVTCWGCTDQLEDWEVGGTTVDLSVGLRYGWD